MTHSFSYSCTIDVYLRSPWLYSCPQSQPCIIAAWLHAFSSIVLDARKNNYEWGGVALFNMNKKLLWPCRKGCWRVALILRWRHKSNNYGTHVWCRLYVFTRAIAILYIYLVGVIPRHARHLPLLCQGTDVRPQLIQVRSIDRDVFNRGIVWVCIISEHHPLLIVRLHTILPSIGSIFLYMACFGW